MDTQNNTKILHKELSYLIQGCCFEIRKEYGGGQKESVYVNLLKECLESKGLAVEKEKTIKIFSSKSGKVVGSYRPDLVVENKIPIEVKSSSFSGKQDEKQLYHYLRNSEYELGYLVNFSTKRLFIKRIIYTNNYKPFLKLVSCIFVFFFVWLSVADAAEVSLQADLPEFGVGDEILVDVLIDTGDETLNAVQGEILFPAEILEMMGVYERDSVIITWLEKPHLVETGRIVFGGAAPGGFGNVLTPTGVEPNRLMSVVFRGKKEGKAELNFGNIQAFLNDGEGTEASLTASPLVLTVSGETGKPNSSKNPILTDEEPPENFEPIIARDQAVGNDQWFLVFSTQDKESGVDHYEILERRLFLGRWRIGESPYILKDQSLRSRIFVKAADRAGNVRVVELAPFHPLKWYEDWFFWTILIVVAVGALFFERKLWRRRITHK
ncbi:MAG TPA: GxxExxY protein [Candidatus Paceibacterota bacterium]|nr:GxxExxY protein [Candidatus Paceibacterota bacterium]